MAGACWKIACLSANPMANFPAGFACTADVSVHRIGDIQRVGRCRVGAAEAENQLMAVKLMTIVWLSWNQSCSPCLNCRCGFPGNEFCCVWLGDAGWGG